MITEEDEGIEIFCPFCQKPVLIPAGYNRPTYLCTRDPAFRRSFGTASPRGQNRRLKKSLPQGRLF